MPRQRWSWQLWKWRQRQWHHGTATKLYKTLCLAMFHQISDFAVKLQFSTSETVSVSEALRKLVQEKEKAWKSAYEDQDIPKIPKAVAVGGMSCTHFCSRIQHDHTRINKLHDVIT